MAKANDGILFEDKRGNVAPLMKPTKGSTYDFTYTGTAGKTAEITEDAVRILCTTNAFIKIGETDAVAASSSDYDMFVLANQQEDIKLFGSDKYISAVQVTTGGTCYINGWV